MFVKIENMYINLNNVEFVETNDDNKAKEKGYEINIRFVDSKYLTFSFDTKAERDSVVDVLVHGK